MRRPWPFRGKSQWLIFGLLLLLAAGVWWYRTPLLCWYHLNGLASAGTADRQRWIDAVVGLDVAAVPGLLDLLKRDHPGPCANAEATLAALLQHWGPDDNRTQEVCRRIEQDFLLLSVPGQQAILELYLVRLGSKEGPPAAVFVEAAGRLLPDAAKSADGGVRERALALAEILVEYQPKDHLEAYTALIRQGLADDNPDNRVRAIHLTMHSALRHEANLLQPIKPLLRHAEVKVRRAALLALSMEKPLISAEELMPLLHDPDAEVRKSCVSALYFRGLSDTHIQLARFLTDPKALARLDVIPYLEEKEDVEPGIWLRRLSQDPEQAVRAAAAQAAAYQPVVDLSDRLRQMANDDPSPTVRQLARYYLQLPRPTSELPGAP